MIEDYKHLVTNYIHAKDTHRPHLMKLTFTEKALLEMSVNTDAIKFPTAVEGLGGITKTLVSDFHKQYENVYTFCFSNSAVVNDDVLHCHWLVVMTDIASGSLKIGWGDYHWRFCRTGDNDELRVQKLYIYIHAMNVVSSDLSTKVFTAFHSLQWPWVRASELSLPEFSNLIDLDYLVSEVSEE